MQGEYSLVYDAGCGPCTLFKSVVSALDSKRNLEFVSLARAEQAGLLDRVEPERRFRSFHLVAKRGTTSGADALPQLAKALLPAGELFARALDAPLIRSASRFAYSTLSRLHQAGDCRARR